MFEKFYYADPCKIEEVYPELWDFATLVTLEEYAYMQDTIILPPQSTDKNVLSTPAFPKFMLYETEEDYMQHEGWKEYNQLWNMDVEELKKEKPLWWTFLKNETLKKKKIKDNDIRMIMCTDPVYTRMGASFEQDQNARMKQHTETHQAQVGWSPFYGGLDRRLKRLQKNKDQFIEMDWTRYDGTIPTELFFHIKMIRWFFISQAYKTKENLDRYMWYVENLMNKLVLLPTGEITVIKKGNPSGQISTTTDNNMVNTWLTAFEVAFQYKKKNGRVPTLMEYKENVDSICYGDDRLLAVNSGWLEYDTTLLPNMYKNIFGMWVKPENIKIQNTLENLSFCGLVFHLTKSGFMGIPNVNKILSTIEFPVRKLPDLLALWGKLTSLRLLCEYADSKVKDYLEVQLARVREHAEAEGIELPEVPMTFYSQIWTGGPK
nr:RNA-dependent RNA polymerase [Crow astrovirus]